MINPKQNNPLQPINPVSTYCINQGHELKIQQTELGEIRICVSKDKQECEEGDFFKGDCSFDGFEKCVKASCCHASSCVLESNAPACSNIMCTMECALNTMDCGRGTCGFVKGNCEVIWNE